MTFQDVVEIKGKEYRSLYLNTTVGPDESIPLDFYTYIADGEKIKFFRLYSEVYILDSAIRYTMNTWHPVKVKLNCIQALKNQIDATRAYSEFLD